MIHSISIHNFKKLEQVNFSLSDIVAIIGPNNSGKTTVFQALCLWEVGVTAYLTAQQKGDLDRKGHVVVNRRDLLNSPVSDARFLWNNKKVTHKSDKKGVEPIRLSVELKGENFGKNWVCKAEFIFSNAESFTCRIVEGAADILEIYDKGGRVHFGFLQTMSGISTLEDQLQQGAIERRLGEGKTAEVLRNLCFAVLYPSSMSNQGNAEENWKQVCKHLRMMFGVELQAPAFIKTNGSIELTYKENGIVYDISAGGRGFLQTLLLLAYMYSSPNTILLLDEPDAHLEIIRQRQIFQLLMDTARATGSQVLIASHSEVVLTEAANSAKVVALIENQAIELNTKKTSSFQKMLTEIGWEKYYQARQKGHVLYLEGSTDLRMLQEFANKLQHPVDAPLRLANVDYAENNEPNTAVRRFTAIRDIFPNLKGIAIFDKIAKNLADIKILKVYSLQRRELENYFARPKTLITHAQLLKIQYKSNDDWEAIMLECINEHTTPARLRNLSDEWWNTSKLTDDWLDPIFADFYKRIGRKQDFYKRDYYQLIKLLQKDEIAEEIVGLLDKLQDLFQ